MGKTTADIGTRISTLRHSLPEVGDGVVLIGVYIILASLDSMQARISTLRWPRCQPLWHDDLYAVALLYAARMTYFY